MIVSFRRFLRVLGLRIPALGILGLGVPLGMIAAPAPSAALEKVPAAAPEDDGFQRADTVVRLKYFNFCNGWAWSWQGFSPNATYGVHYDDVTPYQDMLLKSHFYYSRGVPAGYGYTSLAYVFPPFDPTCPGRGFVLQAFEPRTGWNTIEWNGDEGIPVDDFWVVVRHSNKPGNPIALVTEKGHGPPTAPGGCGTCFLPGREVHSRQFGQEPYIVCPGLPWFDLGPCNLELAWSCDIRTGDPAVSVEGKSWGRVKSLYR